MPGIQWSTMLHPVSRKLCASLCVSRDDLASCLVDLVIHIANLL